MDQSGKCRQRILLTNRDQEWIFADEGLPSRLPRPDALLDMSYRGISWLHNAVCPCHCVSIPDKKCKPRIFTIFGILRRLRWSVSGWKVRHTKQEKRSPEGSAYVSFWLLKIRPLAYDRRSCVDWYKYMKLLALTVPPAGMRSPAMEDDWWVDISA